LFSADSFRFSTRYFSFTESFPRSIPYPAYLIMYGDIGASSMSFAFASRSTNVSFESAFTRPSTSTGAVPSIFARSSTSPGRSGVISVTRPDTPTRFAA
jgi:hypothetical protein